MTVSAEDQTARLEKLIRDQQRQIEALRREVGGIRTQNARRTPAARNVVTKDGVGAKADDEPYVLKGGLPRSWRLPGTDIDVRIGGKVKADVIGRVGGDPSLGAEDLFAVAAIDTRRTRIGDSAFRIHGRESRFNIEFSKKETPLGPARILLEGDFFGAAGNQIASNSDSFRLRHAIVEVGPLLAGQWWTTFYDPGAYAETLDFQGAGGQTFIRQGVVRLQHRFANGFSIAGAIENPEGRVQFGPAAAVVSSRDTTPDFVGNIRYQGAFGHIQLGGAVTQTNAPNGVSGDEVGYAGTLHGRLNLPFLAPKDNIRFQATYATAFTLFGDHVRGKLRDGGGDPLYPGDGGRAAERVLQSGDGPGGDPEDLWWLCRLPALVDERAAQQPGLQLCPLRPAALRLRRDLQAQPVWRGEPDLEPLGRSRPRRRGAARPARGP